MAQQTAASLPRPRRSWSDANVCALAIAYPAGTPIGDIAALLGRSKGSIYGKARRLKLQRPAVKKKALEPDLPTGSVCATADEIRLLLTSSDNPIVAAGQIVFEGDAPTPEPQPKTAKSTREPRPFKLTPLGGRQTVWSPEVIERLLRLWIANVQHDVIAAVLGNGITGSAVQAKARRVGLQPRSGLTMNRDVSYAREIDRKASPLPKVIYDPHNKPLCLRTCRMASVPFYTPRTSHYSLQAKETKAYRNTMF